MTSKIDSIELDSATAAALKVRAHETVPDLVAAYLDEDCAPANVDADQIAELDRRWKAIQDGAPTARHDAVVRWLDTWGSSADK